MVDRFLEILGIRTFEKRVHEYVSLQKEMDIIKSEIDVLAETYQEQENTFKKSIDSPDNKNIVDILEKRQEKFRVNHIKDIASLKSKYQTTDSKITEIERSYPEIKKAGEQIKQTEAFLEIRKAYDLGQLSTEKFNDIFKAKKGKVHYADVVVYNGKGEILLLKRTKDSDFEPQKLCLPGGHLNINELPEVAAERELNEETGIKLTKEQKLEKIGEYEDSKCKICYYSLQLNSTPETVLDNTEHEYVQWSKSGDLKKDELLSNLYENLKKIGVIYEGKVVEIKKAEEPDFTEDQLKELIEEHEKLVTLLEKHSDKNADIKKEAEKQRKELEGYKESLKNFSSIKKAFENGFLSEEIFLKAKSGIYKNTLENRKLNRVRQKYGSKELKEALKKIEKEIVNLDYEHGYCFDVEGKEKFNHTDHLPNKINIPARLYPKLHNSIFTHNHTVWQRHKELEEIGSPLSKSDFKIACDGRVKEIRSVSGKYIYSLSKKDKSVFLEKDYKALSSKFNEGLKEAQKTVGVKEDYNELETVKAVHIINGYIFKDNPDYVYKTEKL